MNKKTIFFDVDNTLLGTRNGKRFCIPPSTLEALSLLKRNGHRVAIGSGRPESFIRLHFPGIFTSYVAMNGSHVVFEGETVFLFEFSAEKVRSLMEHFDSFGCCYTFVGSYHGWPRNIPQNTLDTFGVNYGVPGYLCPAWRPEDVRASMLDFMFTDEEHYRRCRPAFDDTMVLNRNPALPAADLSFKGRDKASGVRALLRYAGIDPKDTIAFGDSYNDLTMMKAVGFSVAMGNGVDAAKQAADYVTAPIFEDGIYKALKHLELI
ncbi:MAG: HAD hydrolase family protein [Clostridiales bacterium]|jgi:Cof subfamily protein (haloacid dehalogenase superfamily)|nr:HAD hydrolase family protein [Clostridiales bacterium]